MGSFLSRSRRAWLYVWGVPTLVFLVLGIVTGQGREGVVWAGQFFLAFFVSLFTFEKTLKTALMAVLVFFAASALVEPLLSKQVWQNPYTRGLTSISAGLKQNLVSKTATRSWRVPPGVSDLELSFEARVVEGQTGWDWFRSEGGFELTPLEESRTFTRVKTPLGRDPYLMRTFDLKSPAGGRTFKVGFEMRAPTPVEAQRCRGVWLQTWDPGSDTACEDVALTPRWRGFSRIWTAPPASTSHVIRVVLNNLDGLTYDVKGVKLFELREDGWVRLEPLLQEGAAVTVASQGADTAYRASYGFVPDRTWRRFDFKLKVPGKTDLVNVLLTVGSGQSENTVLEVKDTRLTTSDGRNLTSQPTYERVQLWFTHANLAAHTVLSVSLAALSTVRLANGFLLVSLLAGYTLLSVGSRAALLAFGLGVVWFHWFLFREKRAFLFAFAAATLIIGIGLISTDQFRNALLAREGTSRLEIWQVAGHALLEHPWTGIGADFPGYWRATYRGDSQEIVSHAHNFWLQFAALYGLPGLVAALWLTGGLLYLAWRWGRWRGLALVVPVFMMNVFDYTFFYSGVLFPLLLGMNALRQGGSGTQAKP